MSPEWRDASAVLRLLGGLSLLLLLLCPQAAWSDCSLPPDVPNAQPALEGRTRFPEQSIVTYKCNKGFVKVPGKPDSVVCLTDNEWSQIAEFCNRSCDVPTRLLFASLKQPYKKQSYFPEGSTVEYECRAGYNRDHSLSGNLTCLQNFMWSKPDEFCQKKSCPHPGEMTNGRIDIITDISFGASIIFSCNMGYKLVGATSSYCIVVGNNVDWSDPLPECKGDCSLPPDVPNAQPALEGRTRFPEQSIVTYKCNKGFVKVPGKPDSVVCLTDNEWSQIAEFCNRSCDVPTRLLFASLKQPYKKQSYFPEGSTVEYECRAGYNRDHSLSGNLTCLQNFMWSKPDEFCQKKSCPHPGEMTNGRIDIITDISFGASIIFSCNMGYKLVGATSSYCIVVGNNVDWSDPLPECKGDCSLPPDVPNAQPALEGRTRFPEQSIVTYKCNKGFVKVPGKPDSVVCLTDNEWSQIAEFCNRSCDVPTRLLFASLKQPYKKQSYFPEGSTVEYECRAGYNRDHSLSGNLTCLQNFMWSKPDEFCQKKSCPHPGEMTNGRIDIITDISFGASIIFSCNMGYKLVGATSSYCIVVGNNVDWSDPLPECKAHRIPVNESSSNHAEDLGDCSLPPDVPNAQPALEGRTRFPEQSTVTYKCNKGFVKVPGKPDSVVCLTDNEWSQIAEFCNRSCDVPTRLLFASLKQPYKKQSYFPEGSTVEYECRAGYNRDHSLSGNLTCLQNFMWSKPDEFCQKKSCPHPGEMTNGRIGIITDISFGASIIFSCNMGYKLVGATSSYCIVVGNNVDWSDPSPECKAYRIPVNELSSNHAEDLGAGIIAVIVLTLLALQ